jgi:hypothetical protein
MPSTPSPSLRAEMQAAGENLNTWGDTRLNTALKMLEAGGHGLTSHTLTGNVSLTYTNYTQTNGTDFVQKIAAASDGAYTLTLGGYERAYLIWNASSYDQIIACSGTSVTVYAGEIVPVYCDGTDVVRVNLERVTGDLNVSGTATIDGAASFGGLVTAASVPVSADHLVNKLYVDGLALAQADLPGQSSATKFASVTSDGSAASWVQDIQPEVITSATTAVARRRPYFCDMSGGSYALTLPASPSEGDIVRFMTDGNAVSNALTIGRNGETIGGVAEDMTVAVNGFSGLLFYTSSDWKVLSL